MSPLLTELTFVPNPPTDMNRCLSTLAPRLGRRTLACARAQVALQVRRLHASRVALHGSFERKEAASPEDVVMINVVDRNQKKHLLKGKVGDNLLYLMHKFQDEDKDLMLEGA